MKDDVFLRKSTEVPKKILEILELELDELKSREKDLISVYCFGIIEKIAQENLILEQLKNIGIKKMLIEVLKYPNEGADKILKGFFDSIQEKGDEGFHIMIYQGEASYHDYNVENYNEIYDNLTNMMDVVIRKDYKNY